MSADMLKVVYSWLGPKGPLWNTEVPNLYSLAHEAENLSPQTFLYWSDQLWQNVFKNRKEKWYLWPNSEVTNEDIFVFPYSLYWRIFPDRFFMAGSGLCEFGQTSGHILEHVRTGKGFIIIELGVEAYIDDRILTNMHHYFNGTLHLPMNKIIYLTGCMNAKQIYDEWCKYKNIPDEPHQRMNVVAWPSSQGIFSRQHDLNITTEPFYDENYFPEKLFLSWNRRFREHRLNLAIALNKHNLIDKSYWALSKVDPESPRPFLECVNINGYTELGITNEDIQNLHDKLPLIVDGETVGSKMCTDEEMATRKYYTNSLVSLVTETNYREPNVSLTEKSFKPLREKHPFIIVGSANSLSSLRELGFKTFHDFWDESYDQIHNHYKRLDAIVKLCREISQWDKNRVLEFRRQVKPILEHNFNLLKERPEKLISERIAKYVLDQLLITNKISSEFYNKMKTDRGIN